MRPRIKHLIETRDQNATSITLNSTHANWYCSIEILEPATKYGRCHSPLLAKRTASFLDVLDFQMANMVLNLPSWFHNTLEPLDGI